MSALPHIAHLIKLIIEKKKCWGGKKTSQATYWMRREQFHPYRALILTRLLMGLFPNAFKMKLRSIIFMMMTIWSRRITRERRAMIIQWPRMALSRTDKMTPYKQTKQTHKKWWWLRNKCMFFRLLIYALFSLSLSVAEVRTCSWKKIQPDAHKIIFQRNFSDAHRCVRYLIRTECIFTSYRLQ